jgi:RNA polymerase sigma-70 factor (ECF subfamily)
MRSLTEDLGGGIPSALTVRSSLIGSGVVESVARTDKDATDIRSTLDGDGEAYARLVRRHQEKVAARMWRFTRDRADHEELVQETFVESYRSLPTYRGDAPFEHWLARISVRVGYRYWKRNARERERNVILLEDMDTLVHDDPSGLDPEWAASTLHGLLQQLSPRNRLVITLRYVEGRSVDETAKLTGWSRSMVKVQAWRARQKLKKMLQEAGLEVDA